MSEPIAALLAHYEIDEKSLEVTPKQLKRIKADMKRYKAAITDTTIRDLKRMDMTQEKMTKSVWLGKEQKVTEYIPPMPTSTGAIKLSAGDKLRPSDGGHQRKAFSVKRATVITRTATIVKKQIPSRQMAANILDHYTTLLTMLKKK